MSFIESKIGDLSSPDEIAKNFSPENVEQIKQRLELWMQSVGDAENIENNPPNNAQTENSGFGANSMNHPFVALLLRATKLLQDTDHFQSILNLLYGAMDKFGNATSQSQEASGHAKSARSKKNKRKWSARERSAHNPAFKQDISHSQRGGNMPSSSVPAIQQAVQNPTSVPSMIHEVHIPRGYNIPTDQAVHNPMGNTSNNRVQHEVHIPEGYMPSNSVPSEYQAIHSNPKGNPIPMRQAVHNPQGCMSTNFVPPMGNPPTNTDSNVFRSPGDAFKAYIPFENPTIHGPKGNMPPNPEPAIRQATNPMGNMPTYSVPAIQEAVDTPKGHTSTGAIPKVLGKPGDVNKSDVPLKDPTVNSMVVSQVFHKPGDAIAFRSDVPLKEFIVPKGNTSTGTFSQVKDQAVQRPMGNVSTNTAFKSHIPLRNPTVQNPVDPGYTSHNLMVVRKPEEAFNQPMKQLGVFDQRGAPTNDPNQSWKQPVSNPMRSNFTLKSSILSHHPENPGKQDERIVEQVVFKPKVKTYSGRDSMVYRSPKDPWESDENDDKKKVVANPRKSTFTISDSKLFPNPARQSVSVVQQPQVLSVSQPGEERNVLAVISSMGEQFSSLNLISTPGKGGLAGDRDEEVQGKLILKISHYEE